MKKSTAIFISVLLCIAIYAEEKKQVFMVYGQDFMVNLPLPNTWQVDMDFAIQNELNGYFFIKEYGIRKSPVRIIMELAERESMGSSTFDWVDFDRENLLGLFKDYEIRKMDTQRKQENNYVVYLYEFKNKYNIGHYQIIAYIDCNAKYYVKIYIDCKMLRGNEKYLEDFISGVYSVLYLNIRIEEKD